jgi:hypothetical protein
MSNVERKQNHNKFHDLITVNELSVACSLLCTERNRFWDSGIARFPYRYTASSLYFAHKTVHDLPANG